MPLQNRVSPWGAVVATPERGAMMGNRGCLHDAGGTVIRSWTRKAWICCRLEFKGRHRQVMAPGRYTELFFLDEATAFAAGHRPCATCRREAYNRFRSAWSRSVHGDEGQRFDIKAVDERLHAERVRADGSKVTFSELAGRLPDGVMVVDDGVVSLLWKMALHTWSFSGYGATRPVRGEARVVVLTPASLVRVLAAGYAAASAVGDC